MSQEIVKSLQAPFNYTSGMLKKFIEICPDNIWQEKSGGWPVWQQVYHALSATDFFISSSKQAPLEPPLNEEVANLGTAPQKAISRTEMTKLAQIMEERANKYFAGLTDNLLAKKDDVLSAGMGSDSTHALAVMMLCGHLLYHLGSCDAALRNHGLEGVF